MKVLEDIPIESLPIKTEELVLLFVEDDQISRSIGMLWFGKYFNKVHEAVDGAQGLEKYHETKPDLIITDQIMPELSGLEMIRAIRESDRKTPIVLMTSSMDNQILIDAINLGVNRFMPKPLDKRVVLDAIRDISGQIISERFIELHRKQEVELLRYRDSYNSIQQEAAQRKERHVARHDLKNQYLTGAGCIRWGVEVAYSPRDIMSGDGYTVRRIPENRILIFVVDAMGAGLSASINSLLATSFCNFLTEHLLTACHCGFDFSYFISLFKLYLSGMLMPEEAVSCGFLLVDLTTMKTDMALFALPPLLVRNLDGSVMRIRSGNPPFSVDTSDIAIFTANLAQISDIMIITDGVADAELPDGRVYREFIESDFAGSPTLASLQRRFRKRVAETEPDDMTFIHLRRLDTASDWSWSREVLPSIDSLETAVSDAMESLKNETGLQHSAFFDEIEVILTEGVTNALEHGCLGIGREEKSTLIRGGDYENELLCRTPPDDCRIVIVVSFIRTSGDILFSLEVHDSGAGFSPCLIHEATSPTNLCGRGLRMVERLCDAIYVGAPGEGGRLLIFKTAGRENSNECGTDKPERADNHRQY